MNEALAFLESEQTTIRLEKSLTAVHHAFNAQSRVTGGCGLFTGLALPLMANITRLTNEWAIYSEKLRVLWREGLLRSKDRGFTDSQARVIAFFFLTRLVFADMPNELLYGTEAHKGVMPSGSKTLKGLWNVPVDEPDNCQKPWVEVCQMMSASVWACDEMPCMILESLFEQVVQEMYAPEPGFASSVLDDLKTVTSGNPGRYLMQMILDAQLYLRAASAFDMEPGPVLADDLRNELMDGIELVNIVRVRKSNALFNVTQTPKQLYDKDCGPFADCYVRLSDDSVHPTCLPLAVANFIFPNCKDLLTKKQ